MSFEENILIDCLFIKKLQNTAAFILNKSGDFELLLGHFW